MNVVGRRRREEDERASDVFRIAPAAGGDAFQDLAVAGLVSLQLVSTNLDSLLDSIASAVAGAI